MTTYTSPDIQPIARRGLRYWMLPGLCALGIALGPGLAGAEGQQWPLETLRLTQAGAGGGDTFFGTVRAREIAGLSYGARGCIVDVSEDARRERVVRAGQVLVKLDDQRTVLALRTAEARVLELNAAVEERQLDFEAAEADDRRRKEELAFVVEEFERGSVMLGRGLINETSMDAIERRFMDAGFAAERAIEAIANARSAIRRAEIALEIGKLDMQSAVINLGMFTLEAPFDGILVGFDPNVGDCVQEGELAARIYRPDQKSVDVYLRVSRLTATDDSGLVIGAPVQVTRVNGQECGGNITRIDTEADSETQYVEVTVDVEPACAPSLFLNESVEIAPDQTDGAEYSVPNGAIQGTATVFLLDEQSRRLIATEAEIVSRGDHETVVRLGDADGRLLVTESRAAMVDGVLVDGL